MTIEIKSTLAIIEVNPTTGVVLEFQTTGVQGPKGNDNLFVQPTQPTATGPYLWVQTGLGQGGTGMTLWIEDGQP